MKKVLGWGIAIVLVAVVGVVSYIYWQELRGIWPAIQGPKGDISALLQRESQTEDDRRATQGSAELSANIPLRLPPGFKISIWADKLPSARVIIQDGQGNFLVSQQREGTISLLEAQAGRVTAQHVLFRDLKNPHGLAIDPKDPLLLYVAEEHQVSRIRLYSEGTFEKITDLPSGLGHSTRTLGFGPDDRLYVSIGSSCNVCEEKDDRRSKIFSMKADGSDRQEVARGLRNAVFFTWHENTNELWATEMGRDLLGDDLPPDEINVIRQGGDYGWPYCYGNNVRDTSFGAKSGRSCDAQIPSTVDLQAHSAPLGLAFIPSSWPAEYRGDLLVAYHGSWNRSEPTGYKVVRIKLDDQGKFISIEDFISGWLADKSSAWGRPVDLKFADDGTLYITDDKAGVIYQVNYES